MSDEQCRSFTNGIWLCDGCSRLVDDNKSAYTKGTLQAWKTEAENYVAELSTQDTRLSQLRGMLMEILSALGILSGIPRFGGFDASFSDAGGISWARRYIEVEQLLFENTFQAEAETVKRIGDELVNWIHPEVRSRPNTAFLDISDWKNSRVRTLMLDVMRFGEASYVRYFEREMKMVEDERARLLSKGFEIVRFKEPPF